MFQLLSKYALAFSFPTLTPKVPLWRALNAELFQALTLMALSSRFKQKESNAATEADSPQGLRRCPNSVSFIHSEVGSGLLVV